MEFIPGSNNWPVLGHGHPDGDSRVHSLECIAANFDASKAVPCPLPASGCTIHKGRTLHYSGPNTSDQSRYAYVLIFLVGTLRTEPRAFPWQQDHVTAR